MYRGELPTGRSLRSGIGSDPNPVPVQAWDAAVKGDAAGKRGACEVRSGSDSALVLGFKVGIRLKLGLRLRPYLT